MSITFVSSSASASSSACALFDLGNRRPVVPSPSSPCSTAVALPLSTASGPWGRSIGRCRTRISCEVAELKSSGDQIASSESELGSPADKVGARVRVKVPLKVYHVPKVPEIDLEGMEGVIKQYVVEWKGKRISANLPFKVEFRADGGEARPGPIKFFAHLRDDEFEYLD